MLRCLAAARNALGRNGTVVAIVCGVSLSINNRALDNSEEKRTRLGIRRDGIVAAGVVVLVPFLTTFVFIIKDGTVENDDDVDTAGVICGLFCSCC